MGWGIDVIQTNHPLRALRAIELLKQPRPILHPNRALTSFPPMLIFFFPYPEVLDDSSIDRSGQRSR